MVSASGLTSRDLMLALRGVTLPGRLSIPAGASALVVFVHGSGSNRFSPRNRAVAEVLHQGGLATLLFDLLAADEAAGASGSEPDLGTLSRRLLAVLAQLKGAGSVPDALGVDLATLPIGLFGSSSGAAVALAAAAEQPELVGAIVSRGGRPDLVLAALGGVRAPTLLLVGSQDVDVLELNCLAAAQLQCQHELRVVPGAGHLFAETGAIDRVARWSRRWFLDHLR